MQLRYLITSVLALAGCGYRPGTPLTNAAFEGRTGEMAQILGSGYNDPADIREALVGAARSGHALAIPALVTYGASLEHRSGVNGWAPLQHAVHKARLAVVTALLDAGADPKHGADHACWIRAGRHCRRTARTRRRSGRGTRRSMRSTSHSPACATSTRGRRAVVRPTPCANC